MDRLPVELLTQVVSHLDIEDFHSLKFSNKHLHVTLKDERVSKTVVQKNIKHSIEAKLADEGLLSYSSALSRLYSTRKLLASAQPSSVLLLGYGSSFAYRDGILCYIYKSTIRILDVLKAARQELVIDTYQLHDPEQYPRFPQKLLNFQAGILSFFYEPMENLVNYIMLININELRNRTTPSPAIMETHALWAMGPHEPQRMFARNNSQIFCFGKHGRTSQNDRHQWGLRTWSFATQTTSRLLQLEGFFGVDIGQTVAFELFDDYLYAVSNQDTEGIEEIDWTSFYNCYRVPITELTKERLQHKRIWRRQHRDGVINDIWTDISLQKDEETGVVTIVEGRREWLAGRDGKQTRTFYRQPLEFQEYENDELSALSVSGCAGSASTATVTVPTALPPNDVLVSAIDQSNKPQYLPPQYRLPYDVHEITQVRPGRHYNPLRTKYRCYNLPASTSLDIASSDENCLNGEPTIHLVVNTRVPSSPIDPLTGRLYLPKTDDEGIVVPGSSDRYHSLPPESWPPKDAPEQLLELLNTHIRARQSTGGLEAVSDGHVLIYVTDSVDDGLGQAIILVNFDARIRFPGLEKLNLRQETGQTMKKEEPELDSAGFSVEAVRYGLHAKKTMAVVWPDRRRMDAIPGMERLLGWQEDAWWCGRSGVVGFQLEY